ncbi:hypothetical protein [Kiloniella antarctica]|uniref:Uncharacterized protein n=1 Tax=Kiloniella antarctica TaxID=1550907 RepID=A0ABW5BKD4_9PROT
MSRAGEDRIIKWQRQQGRTIESGILTEQAGVFAHRVSDQRLIDRYKVRGNITYRQWEAGDRLYTTWYNAGRSPVQVAALTVRVDGGGSKRDMSERQSINWHSFVGALGALPLSMRSLVVNVCLHETTAADHAKAHGHNKDGGMYGLSLSLDFLADHYGMPSG